MVSKNALQITNRLRKGGGLRAKTQTRVISKSAVPGTEPRARAYGAPPVAALHVHASNHSPVQSHRHPTPLFPSKRVAGGIYTPWNHRFSLLLFCSPKRLHLATMEVRVAQQRFTAPVFVFAAEVCRMQHNTRGLQQCHANCARASHAAQKPAARRQST
jgi:hypothetical protein